ncbi:MAG: histidine kinase [Bacteroidetes bacterium]|nr:histidine kinase [Bacteroidota bacterium]
MVLQNQFHGEIILFQKTSLFDNKYKIWLILFGVALFFGLSSTVSSFLYYIGNNQEFHWDVYLPQRLPSYFMWALFVPLIHSKVAKQFSHPGSVTEKVIKLTGWIILISVMHRLLAFISIGLIMENLGEILSTLFSNPKEIILPLISLSADSFMLTVIIGLTAGVIEYSRFIKQENVKQEEIKRRLVESQLQNLTGNLHPHFLFNALHGISMMIYKDPMLADKMISSLSDLLRSTFQNSEDQFITLKKEIEIGRNYLSIQKLRFGARIVETVELPGMGGDVMVPKFILLPLLENCIKHNVDITPESVEIGLKVAVSENDISIVVRNSRPVRKVKDPLPSGEGLKQIKARLEILYGENFKFNIKETDSEYIVEINVPVSKQ